jgi:hypothetical protein
MPDTGTIALLLIGIYLAWRAFKFVILSDFGRPW